MTQAKTQLTIEEYLNLDAEGAIERGLPEGRCEYVAEGAFVELPPESRPNLLLANYLLIKLIEVGVSLELVYTHACEIEVMGKPRTRYPDVIVIRPEHLALTLSRATITLKMPPPQLLVEVVSPGEKNQKRDYEDKRKQYQERGIPEFWLIDPARSVVSVLTLEDGSYKVAVFRGSDRIESEQFKQLDLTAQQILSARM